MGCRNVKTDTHTHTHTQTDTQTHTHSHTPTQMQRYLQARSRRLQRRWLWCGRGQSYQRTLARQCCPQRGRTPCRGSMRSGNTRRKLKDSIGPNKQTACRSQSHAYLALAARDDHFVLGCPRVRHRHRQRCHAVQVRELEIGVIRLVAEKRGAAGKHGHTGQIKLPATRGEQRWYE